MNKIRYYRNNENLKGIGCTHEFTKEMVDEYMKCKNDIFYFLENHYYITTIDDGLVKIELWDYQKEAIDLFTKHNDLFILAARQMSKTTIAVGYILHYILFNKDKKVGILANKIATSVEVLDRLKNAYEQLPLWLQHAVLSWNVRSIELETGTMVITSGGDGNSIRGKTISLLYIDEFAFIQDNKYKIFAKGVLPSLSSGKTTKILLTTTPNGLNFAYKIYTEALHGLNNYKVLTLKWDRHPFRDEEWKRREIQKLGSESDFNVEHCCVFEGSTQTLISSGHLLKLATKPPIMDKDGLKVYEDVVDTGEYVLVVDVAKGVGGDSSAISVIKVNSRPFDVVAVYDSNSITPMFFSRIVHNIAMKYNHAYVLVEENMGNQVLDILTNDLEYENVFSTEKKNNQTILSSGFGSNARFGVTTTRKVKLDGCSNLKMLIENDQIVFHDEKIIQELLTFSRNPKTGSFEAESGKHDDLVMTLVLFAWLSDQIFFKDLYENNIRETALECDDDALLPFGFISDGEILNQHQFQSEQRQTSSNWLF